MGVSLTIVDGPAGAPPDVSRIVATVGYAPSLAVASPDTDVAQIDTAGVTALVESIGYGIGPECVARRRRISGVRGLLISHLPSTAGVISSVTQTGLGPAMSVAANDTHPYDDAEVWVKISNPGAPGTATFMLSHGYQVLAQGNVQRLYGPPLTMPERLPATVIGTVDLTTIAYALPAIVTGTTDVSDPTLYGSGGSLAGKTLIIDVDNAGAVTYPIPTGASAPANLDALVALLTANFPGSTFGYTNYPKLTIAGTDLGATGEIDITGGTALTLLGLTVSTTIGTAGSLDGKTIDLEADTGGPQTATFGTGTSAPADADDVLTTLSALTNITASLYSSRNLLKIVSDTVGDNSELSVTGGNALALLGLTTTTSPALGSEPRHVIEHLGVTLTFAPGNYRTGTTYTFTTKAPIPSASEVEDRLRELDAAGFDFGVVHVAAALSATDALTMAGALDLLGAEWEARAGSPRAVHFVIGVDPAELDSVVKSTFAAFRSRRIDWSARGAYTSSGLVGGGARMLRSQSWPAADCDALLNFYEDRGERRLQALRAGTPEVFAITADENLATVKFVNPTGARANVMVQGAGGFYFSGGYSSADASSSFTDASVRNTTHVAFLAAYSELARNQNRTDLDTNSDGTLTQASADNVAVDVENIVEAAIVPGGASAVQATVDTTNDFYSTRKLKGSIKFQNRVPARDVEFDIGPGLITET